MELMKNKVYKVKKGTILWGFCEITHINAYRRCKPRKGDKETYYHCLIKDVKGVVSPVWRCEESWIKSIIEE